VTLDEPCRSDICAIIPEAKFRARDTVDGGPARPRVIIGSGSICFSFPKAPLHRSFLVAVPDRVWHGGAHAKG